MAKISPLAVIEEGAQLGTDVVIEPFAWISSKAKIGDRTTIGQGARIDGDTTIGSDCRIFSHAVVGSIPQDLKFHGEDVRLIIGDRNTIREFTLINPGTEGGGGVTKIGDDNLFMGMSTSPTTASSATAASSPTPRRWLATWRSATGSSSAGSPRSTSSSRSATWR